jgi:hypothetical protein
MTGSIIRIAAAKRFNTSRANIENIRLGSTWCRVLSAGKPRVRAKKMTVKTVKATTELCTCANLRCGREFTRRIRRGPPRQFCSTKCRSMSSVTSEQPGLGETS